MKKVILSLTFSFIVSGVCVAQTAVSETSSTSGNNTSINKGNGNVVLQSGTQIAAQLQNSLDVKKARVGDEVILKTTSAIKQNGQVVVNKGSLLVGRVTEVQQKAKGNAMSRVGILFDRLENGKMTLPIEATISSITQAQSRLSIDDTINSDISGGSSTRSSTRSQGNSGGGGLLGGVTNTVGSVTNTVGGVVNTTTETVGGVTSSIGQTTGGTLRGLQITQSSSTSAEGGSMLSLTGGNLRLEKGTTFNLRLTESISKEDN